jgi:hypothetical protein
LIAPLAVLSELSNPDLRDLTKPRERGSRVPEIFRGE